GDRNRWQMSADGHGGRTGQASWPAPAEARERLPVRLSASSWPGQAESAGQQETPEKRGQKQERQGSSGRGDVYAPGWRGWAVAWTDQQEAVRDVCGSQGRCGLGPRGGDQAWL